MDISEYAQPRAATEKQIRYLEYLSGASGNFQCYTFQQASDRIDAIHADKDPEYRREPAMDYDFY